MPRDGEGIPPDTDDGLLAQVIPLRRRGGEGAAPKILADEPRRPADEGDGVFDPPEDPSVPAERSIWDPAPPPLRRRASPEPVRFARARTRLTDILGGQTRARLIGAAVAVAGTLGVAALLVFALGALHGQSRPTAQHAISAGLQASRPKDGSAGLATRPSSPPHRSSTEHAGSHRRPPTVATVKTTSTVPKFVPNGSGVGVPATVQYHSPAVQSPTGASAAPPAAESSPAPKGSSASASASREFGFERLDASGRSAHGFTAGPPGLTAAPSMRRARRSISAAVRSRMSRSPSLAQEAR